VGGVFVVLAISTGLGFYGISAFVSALARERGFSLSVASLGPTLSFLASGLGGVAAARLLPRTGVRPALLLGAAGTAAGLVGLAYATTAWAAWLSFVLIGGVGAFMAVVPCTSLITRWFEPNPARALTIATTGMSAGGALVSPLVVLFIDRYGLRVAAEMLAVATVVIVAVIGAAIREPAVPSSPKGDIAATGPEPGRTVHRGRSRCSASRSR
jgi:MFS family permease